MTERRPLMRPRLTALAALTAAACACSKPAPPPPPPAVTPPAPVTVTAPSTTQSDPATTPRPAAPKPVTVEVLTEALRVYMQVNSDYPKDLNALVERKLIPRLPAPPPGKKFAIDRKNIAVIVVDP